MKTKKIMIILLIVSILSLNTSAFAAEQLVNEEGNNTKSNRFYYVYEYSDTVTHSIQITQAMVDSNQLAIDIIQALLEQIPDANDLKIGNLSSIAVDIVYSYYGLQVDDTLTRTSYIKYKYRVDKSNGAKHLDSKTTYLTVEVKHGNNVRYTHSYSLRHK